MNTSVHINGIVYDASTVMQEIMDHPPQWKLKGLEFLMQMLDPSESPVIFHTSGTTGIPKNISFSKNQILYSATNTCNYFAIDRHWNLLLCVPANFVAGRLMIARALVSGANLTWIEPSLNPLEGISGIDFAAFTPAQMSAMLQKTSSRSCINQMKTVIIGGGEINCSLEREMHLLTSTLYATYGMTETLTHVAIRKIGDEVYHSVYQDAHFSITDENCLVIDLPFISTDKIITKDVVELLGPTSFKWKGRIDHVINSGGIKLYPEEMEMKLVTAGVLNDSAFYISAQPDPQFGQSPVIVLLKEQAPVDVAAFLKRVNGLLNKHELVKAVIFLDKFEYTDNGKLKRQKFT
jgi:O-succinylbenzoic acid--CoA ligase